MGQKFNPLSGQFDTVLDKAEEIKYDNSTSGLVATEVQAAVDELDAILDALPDPIYYAGTWSAATNTPTLANTDTGVEGALYRVNAAGTVDFGAGNIAFDIGDSVVNNGTIWEKWDHSDQVQSVNGQTGAVDLDTDDIDEGATNLYFTDSRAQNAITGAASTVATANLTANRAVQSDGGGKIVSSAVTSTELGYVSGTTSAIQTQLDAKEPTITVLPVAKGGTNSGTALANNRVIQSSGGAIVEAAAITANRALASDANGIPTHTAVTDTELGYVSGVTSAIQTQLDAKAATTYVDAQDAEYGNRVERNYLQTLRSGASITGINQYADAAASAPVDGTGGSPAGLTTALNTSTPLRRTSSQRFSKDAANRQGEGWSTDITVDLADYSGSSPLYLQFDYKTSANYASGDLRAFAYDITNGTLLNILSLNGDGSLVAAPNVGSFSGVFYPVSTSSSYRIIFHIASTSALAYDLDLIDLSVSPQTTQPGAIVADLGTETWTDNQANATTSVNIQRDGSFGRFVGRVTFTGAMSGGFTLTIPTAYAPSSWYSLPTNDRYDVGSATLRDSGSGFNFGRGVMLSSTSIDIYSGVAYTTLSATTPFTWASGDFIDFDFSWEVANWAASASLSTAETMLVSGRMLAEIASFSIPHNSTTTVTGWTEVFDNQNTFDTSTGIWTCVKSGYYLVSAGARIIGAAGGGRNVIVTKNGTSTIVLGSQTDGASAADQTLNPNKVVQLVNGDTLRMRLYQNQTSVAALSTQSTAAETYFSIQEVPDFSIFSVYGQFELSTATSSVKTPGATNNYHALTSNSLSLTPGTWALYGVADFSNNGSTPAYAIQGANFYAANGADTSSVPALITTISGLSVLSASPTVTLQAYLGGGDGQAQRLSVPRTVIRVTAPTTVYLVSYSTQTTSANARITVYANAERIQ